MKALPPRRGGRRPYSTVSVVNPGKGLNNLISDNLIDDHEASDLENIMFIEAGAPSKAYGYTAVGTGLTNNPRGLGFYNDVSAGNRYLLTMDGTGLKYLNGSTWTSITGVTFDSSAQINMTQALGSMFIWDGVSGGAKLATGLSLSRPGTLPKAKFSIYYGGYHIAAGVGSQENRLYISQSDDAGAFTRASGSLSNSTEVPGATVFSGTTANYIDVNKNDGDRIMALGKFNEVLIVFKERSIYQLTFDSTGTPVIAAVSKGYGAVGHRAVENVDNDLFFLTRNGVYVLGNQPNYFNVIRTNELTARIHPDIDAINPTNFTLASALYSKYVYYLGIPNGSVSANNRTLVYDTRFGAWSRWTHVTPEALCTFVDSTNTEYIYFTSANSPTVYQMTTSYNANGSAISAQWTSKAFDLGDFSTYKRWIDVTILFRQLVGTVDITVYTDNGTIAKSTSINSSGLGGIGSYQFGEPYFGGNVQSSSNTTTLTNNVPYRIKLSTKSRTIKVKVSNNRTNETFVVLGVQFSYRPYSHFVFPSAYKIS